MFTSDEAQRIGITSILRFLHKSFCAYFHEDARVAVVVWDEEGELGWFIQNQGHPGEMFPVVEQMVAKIEEDNYSDN